MAQMATAAVAMHLGPRGKEPLVRHGFDSIVQRGEEAWPAGAAFELGLGAIQRLITTLAMEHAFADLIVQRAGKCAFGIPLAQDGICVIAQLRAPFGRGAADFKVALCHGPGLRRRAYAKRQGRHRHRCAFQEIPAFHNAPLRLRYCG